MSDHPDMERVIALITRLIAGIRNANHTVFSALIRAGSLLDEPGRTYAPDHLAELLFDDFRLSPGKGTQRLQGLNRQIAKATDLSDAFVSHEGRWSLSEPGLDLVRAVRDLGRASHALLAVGRPYLAIGVRCHEVHLHRILTPAAAHIRSVIRQRYDGDWEPSIRRVPAEGAGTVASARDDAVAQSASIWIGGGSPPDRSARRPSLEIPLYQTALRLFLDAELREELWREGYLERVHDGEGRPIQDGRQQAVVSITPTRLKQAVASREIAISLPPMTTYSRRRIDELLGSPTIYNTQYFTRPSGADALTWPIINPRAAALVSDDYVHAGAAGVGRLESVYLAGGPDGVETVSVYAHVRADEMGPLHCTWLLALIDYVRVRELPSQPTRVAVQWTGALGRAERTLVERLDRLGVAAATARSAGEDAVSAAGGG